MKRRCVHGLLLVSIVVLAPFAAPAQDSRPAEPSPPPGGQTPAPRYFVAMQAELQAIGAGAQCRAHSAQLGHCAFRHRGAGSGRTFEIHLTYDDESDSIYVYVDRYLLAPGSAETTPRLLRELMTLNWDMLVGKFEWDRTDGEVRLSAVVNTDSNFDRRAFRSTVRAIEALADRHYADLARVAGIAPTEPAGGSGPDGAGADAGRPAADAGR